MSRIGVVVVAAGSGERLGSTQPKALVALAGQPLVRHAVRGLAAAGLPAPVVVHPGDGRAAFAAALTGTEVAAYVPGGATRTASVAAGVAALPADVEVVVVHDAARPLTPPAVIAAAVAVVAAPPGVTPVLAAAPGVAVADTLKRTAGDEVVATVDRTDLVGIQTPQVFPRPVLEAALALGDAATDELALVERLRDAGQLDGRVVVVPGSVWARKVTYPGDLVLLAVLAAHAPDASLDAPDARRQVGIGAPDAAAGGGA
ncbi:MAG: IspD/TarI family cytidylyltransferase [Nitriliruptoraceae bacterium]